MIELSKSNNLRRADMSYENAPVELTHGHYYICGGLPAGSREAEGDLKQTLKAVAALFKAPEEKPVNFSMIARGRDY